MALKYFFLLVFFPVVFQAELQTFRVSDLEKLSSTTLLEVLK